MAMFFLECYWVGVGEPEAKQAMDRLRRGSASAFASFLLPAEDELFVFLEAPSARAAIAASREACLPADRVSHCIELQSEWGPPSPPA